MSKDRIIQEEDGRIKTILSLFRTVVESRLSLLEIGKWIGEQGQELELAAEEIEGAVNSLYLAEDAINNAHRHLMVARITESVIGGRINP